MLDRLGIHRLHYRSLARVCMDLSLGGFTVHEPRRRELASEVERECARLKGEIRARTPFDIFGKGKRKGEDGKGLSSPKVAGFFYDHLKCKEYRSRVTGSRTCDEEAIRRLMRAYKKARDVGQRVLDFRMWQKRGDFLAASRVDDDGRFRALYAPIAVSGRLTSAENPLGTGSNGQNIPRPPSPVRSMFVPDHGHVLIELDFSRIEDRLLGGMSGDRRMMREAQPGWTGDSYQDVADALEIAERFDDMFGPVTTETDPVHLNRPKMRAYYVRQAGKRTKLASGYGMRGDTMSKALLLETEGALALDPRQCDAWLDKLYALRPGIPAYQGWVRQRMLEDGYLENSWERRIYFRRLRLTDGDYRDGYAWCCQSENGVNTNQLGLRPAARHIKREKIPARVVQQGHDALVLTVAPEASYDLMDYIGDSMGQSRTYPGVAGPWALACPIGYKLGHTWSDTTEWKTRPTAAQWKDGLCRTLDHVWWRSKGKWSGANSPRRSVGG